MASTMDLERGFSVPAASGTYRRERVSDGAIPKSAGMGVDRRGNGSRTNLGSPLEDKMRPSFKRGRAGFNNANRPIPG